jgi:hypothetical protein
MTLESVTGILPPLPPLPLPPLPTLPVLPLPSLPVLPLPTLPLPPLPTLPTLPLPTVPLPTVPLPTVPGPTVPLPTVPGPTVTGPGPTSPPPVPSGPPTATSNPAVGPGSPPTASSGPTSTTTDPPANCPTTSSSTTTDPPDTSDESSTPSSEPAETTEPDTTTTTECEPASTGSTQPASDQLSDPDLTVAAFLAGLEVLAVNAYTTVRSTWTAGTLGDPPPALVNGIDTMLGHHQAALLAWNDSLTQAGRPVVAAAPVQATASVEVQLDSAADAAGVARVLFSLERLVAATYLDALSSLGSQHAIRLAGSILCVGRQHMAVMLFAAGSYPIPETFATTDFAYVP